MFLPLSIQHTGEPTCEHGRSCAPVMAIVGTDPIERESSGKGWIGPDDFEKPGPHRYIGIWMVVGMVVVGLMLYWALGKWPRRTMREWGWVKPLPEAEVDDKKPPRTSLSRVVDEIIPPKQPEKVTMRETRTSRRGRRPLEPWEAGIDYQVKWEIAQHRAKFHLGPPPHTSG